MPVYEVTLTWRFKSRHRSLETAYRRLVGIVAAATGMLPSVWHAKRLDVGPKCSKCSLQRGLHQKGHRFEP